MHRILKVRHGTVEETCNTFIALGITHQKPTKPRETWDVLECTRSGYVKFEGERIPYKYMTDYDPTTGTFRALDATYTLYPLPAT